MLPGRPGISACQAHLGDQAWLAVQPLLEYKHLSSLCSSSSSSCAVCGSPHSPMAMPTLGGVTVDISSPWSEVLIPQSRVQSCPYTLSHLASPNPVLAFTIFMYMMYMYALLLQQNNFHGIFSLLVYNHINMFINSDRQDHMGHV